MKQKTIRQLMSELGYTVKDVAYLFMVHPRTVRRWIALDDPRSPPYVRLVLEQRLKGSDDLNQGK